MDTTTRDQILLQRLYHPQTVPMMDEVIPSRKALYRRLGKLRRSGLVFIVGTLRADDGRPPDVYADRRWKTDNLAHEVMLSRAILLWGVEALRGTDVDQALRPDATLLVPSGQLHVEMDTGSMNLARVESRLRQYLQTDDHVIVITASPARGDRILDRCAFLGGRLWCCSYATAVQNPDHVILTRNPQSGDEPQLSLRRLLTNLSKNVST